MSIFRRYIDFKVKHWLWLRLSLGFVLFTIIGTLTHELGHIAFAKAHGYQSTLHYGSMSSLRGPSGMELEKIWESNKEAIENNLDFPAKERWDTLLEESKKVGWWISFGGPFQTVLTGTIGLILLYRRRKKISLFGMKTVDWLLVFLSMFWLRELANPIVGFLGSAFQGSLRLFGGYSDEISMATSIGWWKGSFSLPLALLALVVAIFVIFKIVPKSVRLSFLLAGLAGGIFGYFFWLEWVGPVVLP